MKIAFYVEDGLEQIVLTPESDTEKGIVGKMHDGTRRLSIYSGEFYDCNGGWKRHKETSPYSGQYGARPERDVSTIIVLRPAPPALQRSHDSDFFTAESMPE